MTLKILSPAKINLFLHVVRRRPDGYHDLFSLMCRIGLFDEIVLRPAASGISLQCSDSSLPADDSNLAFRAARRFFEALGREEGVEIELAKRIPVAAGLGGGSSNAASVLLGLNHLHGRPFSGKKLAAIGRTLGADVPFFLFQSPALAAGIGDRLQAFAGLEPLPVLLVSPAFSVSTRMVYQNLNLRLTNRKKKPTRTHLIETAFDPLIHLYNDLEAVTVERHPELIAVKHLLSEHGALGTLMSGSGPSVFGLFRDRKAARRAATALPGDRGWRVFCVALLTGSIRLIRETP